MLKVVVTIWYVLLITRVTGGFARRDGHYTRRGKVDGYTGVSESMTSDAIVGIPSMYTESRDTVDWGETAPRQRGEVIFK